MYSLRSEFKNVSNSGYNQNYDKNPIKPEDTKIQKLAKENIFHLQTKTVKPLNGRTSIYRFNTPFEKEVNRLFKNALAKEKVNENIEKYAKSNSFGKLKFLKPLYCKKIKRFILTKPKTEIVLLKKSIPFKIRAAPKEKVSEEKSSLSYHALKREDINNLDKPKSSVRSKTPEIGKRFLYTKDHTWAPGGMNIPFEKFLSGEDSIKSSDQLLCHEVAYIYNDLKSSNTILDKIQPKLKELKEKEIKIKEQIGSFRKDHSKDLERINQLKKVDRIFKTTTPLSPLLETIDKKLEKLNSELADISTDKSNMVLLGCDPRNYDEKRLIELPENCTEDNKKIDFFVESYNKKWINSEINPLDRIFLIGEKGEKAAHVAVVREDGSLMSQWTHSGKKISFGDLLKYIKTQNHVAIPQVIYISPQKSGLLTP